MDVFFPLQPPQWLYAASSVLLYLLLCGVVWRGWRQRQALLRRVPAFEGPASDSSQVPTVLVSYASQTGCAEAWAQTTAEQLQRQGYAAQLMALNQCTPAQLASYAYVLFIISTYGDGDPPDNAAAFAHEHMGLEHPQDAASVSGPLARRPYALLALGDSDYPEFCGFGQQFQCWLQAQQAHALFAPIEVDKAAPQALQQWLTQLQTVLAPLPSQALSAIAEPANSAQPSLDVYEQWTLHSRSLLNAGSAGQPVFHLELQPPAHTQAHWLAGDLVQFLPPHEPEYPRQYSIASVPSDGRVHLLVRQKVHPDGSLGQASHWLTDQAPIGSMLRMYLRPNPSFQLADNQHRPLILIANGVGLAGLRSHLKARAQSPHSAQQNWLIFGERNRAHDFLYHKEIQSWQTQGLLQRVDLAFSRDQTERIYVQDQLHAAAHTLQAWVKNGAAVYVCGSLKGMAQEVDRTLSELLGRTQLMQLSRDGRYRRDVY